MVQFSCKSSWSFGYPVLGIYAYLNQYSNNYTLNQNQLAKI